MKISIAMATFNGEKYLSEQLDSFVAQSRLPDELVVCDDQSSDETVQILEDFRKSAPFEVKLVRNSENLGFVRNFEKAMSLCSGDVIFLSDQDDVWLPEKLLTIEREFSANPLLRATINDMIITDHELKHHNVTQLGNIRKTGFGEQRFIAGCCVALRREFVQSLFPFPAELFTHDGWVGDMSVAFGVRKIVDVPLQFYRRHGKNESQWLLSDPKGVNEVKLAIASGFASSVAGWELYLRRLAIMREHIVSRRSDFELIGLTDRINPALAYLNEENTRYQSRIHILSLPRYRRWISVLRFWTQGSYQSFSGWKSAVKDMIRP